MAAFGASFTFDPEQQPDVLPRPLIMLLRGGVDRGDCFGTGCDPHGFRDFQILTERLRFRHARADELLLMLAGCRLFHHSAASCFRRRSHVRRLIPFVAHGLVLEWD